MDNIRLYSLQCTVFTKIVFFNKYNHINMYIMFYIATMTTATMVKLIVYYAVNYAASAANGNRAILMSFL